jgi:hypothetical protein
MQWDLLTSRLNNTSAKYKASTRAQVQHKQYKNKTLNRQNKNNVAPTTLNKRMYMHFLRQN